MAVKKRTRERKDTAYAILLRFADGTRKRLRIEAQGLLNAVRSVRAFHPSSIIVSVALDKRQHSWFNLQQTGDPRRP